MPRTTTMPRPSWSSSNTSSRSVSSAGWRQSSGMISAISPLWVRCSTSSSAAAWRAVRSKAMSSFVKSPPRQAILWPAGTLWIAVMAISRWVSSTLCREAHLVLHDVGELLADHDRRRIGVARDHGWHHRGIGDAQPLDADYLQLGIDHRHRIDPHLAGAGRVIDRAATLARIVEQLDVARHRRAGLELLGDKARERGVAE